MTVMVTELRGAPGGAFKALARRGEGYTRSDDGCVADVILRTLTQ